MNAIILKGAALRQPPLPQSGPRAKTIAHPCPSLNNIHFTESIEQATESLPHHQAHMMKVALNPSGEI
jgi:hypothetical protein